MKKKIMLLRVSYWVAALADLIVAILVLIPNRMGVPEFVYPMGLMSAVAFSWGVLLIIADRKPIERRWVLQPTILVVFLLGVAAVYGTINNLIPAGRLIPTSVAVVGILYLLIYTYFKTRG